MSKRLQVIFEDEELREIQKIAKKKRMTVAEWVRGTLRAARRGESTGDPDRKLKAIQAASRHSFPSGNIQTMLKDIEAGYAGKRR